MEVKLYKAENGKKLLEGTLLGLKEGVIGLRLEDGTEIELPLEKAAKVNLAVVF